MLLKKELKFNYKSFLIWSMILLMFSWLVAPFIDGIMKDADMLSDFINSMPKFILKVFNMDESFITPEGFFSAKVMIMAEIFAAIFAIFLASNVFVNEYETKTIEYILTKPITRNQIFLKKAFAVFIYYTIFAAIFCVSVLLLFNIYVNYAYNATILAGFALYLFVIEIFFGALTFLLSVIFQNSFSTISISMGVFLIMYVGDMFGTVVEKWEWIRYITIFKYIPLGDTVKYSKVYVMNSIMIILIGFLITYFASQIFKNEDILI
ncbi:hypothetical protein X275_08780 [Marinitoga sp. 1197]|uniref:ABC transporter permease n=1 Tax=Marinitoga sp. 1197 TaxID=1428449 RepID=UPI0006413316|nr:ABC transporter permease subunit [Marinitoga sp. 1197]KLO21526.1 hypothetical protein X275_08780 [Marinitoga sp. 1197]